MTKAGQNIGLLTGGAGVEEKRPCGYRRGTSGFGELRLGLGKTQWGRPWLNQRSETAEVSEG